MRAQLVPMDGSPPIEIVKDLVIVGRKEECDLRLDHKSVSKMHCIIVKTDGLLLLRDLGSTNGTRVNGTRVRRAALLPNDQIAIANYKFRVYLGPDAPPPPVAAPAADAASEHTQRLEADDVAGMLEQMRGGRPNREENRDSAEMPVAKPFQRNQLPDVYPDDGGAGPG
jgi:predicted component of type VI protein secretion system